MERERILVAGVGYRVACHERRSWSVTTVAVSAISREATEGCVPRGVRAGMLSERSGLLQYSRSFRGTVGIFASN